MRRYKPSSNSTWGVFLGRVLRGDLNGLQYLWVVLIFGIPIAAIAYTLYLYGEYVLKTLAWISFLIGIVAIVVRVLGFSKRIRIKFIELLKNRLITKEATAPHLKIKMAPGLRLLRIVEWVFSEKTVELEFKPMIAEWHHEYFEALKEKRWIKAHWVSTRHRYGFFKSIIKSEVISFFRNFLSAGK